MRFVHDHPNDAADEGDGLHQKQHAERDGVPATGREAGAKAAFGRELIKVKGLGIERTSECLDFLGSYQPGIGAECLPDRQVFKEQCHGSDFSNLHDASESTKVHCMMQVSGSFHA